MEESKTLRVEVNRRETIKPSSPNYPNPDHQRSFKLSLLGQFMSHFRVPLLLFYKATTTPLGGGCEEISKRLKSSLSETLTRFYPFAGRLKDELSINCNDESVEFSEAQVLDCSLSDVLEKPDQKHLDLLLPCGKYPDISTCPLLLVQVCFFKSCGGMSLGIKVSHKVADATTLSSFIKAWVDSSSFGNAVDNNSVIPDFFSASTLFPPADSLPPPPEIQNRKPIAVRSIRLVFEQAKLRSLQAKATGTKTPRPTRFEAVSAFILQNVFLSGKESRLKLPSSELSWAVNLRPKLKPTLSEHCFGNLVGSAVHKRCQHEEIIEEEKDFPSLAYHLRHGTIDLCNHFIQELKGDQSSAVGSFELQKNARDKPREAIAGSLELCSITSWCKLPFYDADFGWGKPLWVTTGAFAKIADRIVLMDTRDGDGIEAWVTLSEEKMAVFECNEELQKYASFNPSATST